MITVLSYLGQRWFRALVLLCVLHAVTAGYLLSGVMDPAVIIQTSETTGRAEHPVNVTLPNLTNDSVGSLNQVHLQLRILPPQNSIVFHQLL